MSVHWKSVLPVDRYVVRMNGLLHDDDRKVLTQLYQPLMGAAAYSLYMTFWSELEQHAFWGKPSTHHSLMTVMQLNLKQIFEQRKKLEGLSLLKTFVKEDKEARVFLYELEAPLTPHNFFYNDVLSVYLYNRIGRQRFNVLKKQFSYPAVDASEYREMTSAFDEVFDSLQHSELIPDRETKETIELADGEEWAGRKPSDGVRVSAEPFDFEMLLTHLSGLIVPKEAISEGVKEVIMKLAYVYNIEPLEMSKIVERAYFKRAGTMEVDAIRKEVADWYAFEHDNKLPTLSFRRQPSQYQTMANREPQNEEEKIIRGFETYSPAELLEQSGGGAKPAPADLKVVEGIMLEQKLQPGVVNVLIDYVMQTNDMKFTRGYVQKIAGHWARKQVKTTKEAMELARTEHRKYQKWNEPNPKRSKVAAPRMNPRQDKLPKWMTEEEQLPTGTDDWDMKKKQLEKRLMKYKQTNEGG